jgi:succinate dehydrogenase/fumarate reductase iron-sulfur protein
MLMNEKVSLDIFRYDPSCDTEPRYETYEVPYWKGISVLNCLEYINKNYEPIAFQRDCKRYICGSCTVKLNGTPVLACKRKIAPSEMNQRLKFEPLTCLPLIKDLMVDFSEDLRARSRLRPSPENLKLVEGLPLKLESSQYEQQKPYALCIRCHACVEVCPAIKKEGSRFIGPLLMQDIARLSVDKRDGANRFIEAVKEGLQACKGCPKICNKVCPADLDVYGITIQRLEIGFRGRVA